MNNKKAITLFLLTIGASFLGFVLSSLAWFGSNNKVNTKDKLGGSVLQGYFHCGDGSAEYEYDDKGNTIAGPFTITTPWHYENFVKLHYMMPEFAEEGYHFALGYPLKGSSNPVFYETNENGVVNVEDTSEILNLGGIELPPLGTEELPFIGYLEGNDLTVENFTIVGDGLTDIGIFGYVNSAPVVVGEQQGSNITEGAIKNCYWGDFVVDTTKGDRLAQKHSIESSKHDDNIHMGYLAGHTTYSAAFTDCYINDCTLRGSSPSSQGIDTYGYYGKAEIDSLGGSLNKGNDYSFTLNSQACYNYFSNNYSAISNNQLVLRNTEETADMEPNSNGDKIKRITNQGSVTEFNTAVNNNNVVVNPRYRLNGNNPDSPAGNNTYSLSTIGFASPELIEEYRSYNAYYIKNDVKTIPEIEPYYSGRSLLANNDGLIKTEDGQDQPSYYYFKDTEAQTWKYGISYNRKVTEDDKDDFVIKMSMDSFRTEELSYTTPSIDISGKLYIDDEPTPRNLSIKATASRIGNMTILGAYFNVDFTIADETISNLTYGEHYFSIVIQLQYQGLGWTGGGGTKVFTYGELSDNNTVLTPIGNPVNNAATKSVSIHFSNAINAVPTTIVQKEFSFDPTYTFVDSRSVEYPINFYQVTTDSSGNIQESANPAGWDITQQFGETDIFYYDLTNTRKWYISKVITTYSTSGDALDYFVADRSDLVESGYNYENIDVVGGNTDFYYHKFSLFNIDLFSVAVISIPSEARAGQVVKPVGTTDIGKPFYATKYCADSVILYIKNTSNAVDDRNDTLGSISFTYVQINIGAFNLDLVTPTFKKGDGFNNLSQSGINVTTENPNNFTERISLTLTEDDVKKVSYCALDKDGNILGRYTSDGTTTMTNAEQAKIDTYVLSIGGTSNNDTDTWITNVDFSYKAKNGYGGNFSSVGYRSADETIESTILNFYFENPENNVYYVKVSYADGVYTIVFTSVNAISVNFFNYDHNNYSIVVNDEPYNGSEFTVNIEGTSPPST